ncbi:MAG: rhodanese-like domain-containing protein [Muricomes sp.]|uniref:rhodanese-like domain-containing protein n=1 Tax=Faecalicatena contorta TaxID=39482 RepID=UPI002EBA1B5F|nr:rhodanese-like domain-containing protein [Muricomes sp.]
MNQCITENNFITICGGEPRPSLSLTDDGNLWKKMPESAWEPVRFQETYQGYYPFCRFTHLIATDVDFVAAGLGEDGLPYVFRSIWGGVWDMVNLTGKDLLNGYVRVSGKVNEMLFDCRTKQIFLFCDNGELVTLPDCPKCIKIKRVAEEALIHGSIAQEVLCIQTASGSRVNVPLREAVQIRVSVSYAKQKVKEGGTIIDLRETELDDLPDILDEGRLRKDLFLGFLCEYGVQADEAARYARRHGFAKAYSLGGSNPLFHEE